jgi:hypothetical protein
MTQEEYIHLLQASVTFIDQQENLATKQKYLHVLLQYLPISIAPPSDSSINSDPTTIFTQQNLDVNMGCPILQFLFAINKLKLSERMEAIRLWLGKASPEILKAFSTIESSIFSLIEGNPLLLEKWQAFKNLLPRMPRGTVCFHTRNFSSQEKIEEQLLDHPFTTNAVFIYVPSNGIYLLEQEASKRTLTFALGNRSYCSSFTKQKDEDSVFQLTDKDKNFLEEFIIKETAEKPAVFKKIWTKSTSAAATRESVFSMTEAASTVEIIFGIRDWYIQTLKNCIQDIKAMDDETENDKTKKATLFEIFIICLHASIDPSQELKGLAAELKGYEKSPLNDFHTALTTFGDENYQTAQNVWIHETSTLPKNLIDDFSFVKANLALASCFPTAQETYQKFKDFWQSIKLKSCYFYIERNFFPANRIDYAGNPMGPALKEAKGLVTKSFCQVSDLMGDNKEESIIKTDTAYIFANKEIYLIERGNPTARLVITNLAFCSTIMDKLRSTSQVLTLDDQKFIEAIVKMQADKNVPHRQEAPLPPPGALTSSAGSFPAASAGAAAAAIERPDSYAPLAEGDPRLAELVTTWSKLS